MVGKGNAHDGVQNSWLMGQFGKHVRRMLVLNECITLQFYISIVAKWWHGRACKESCIVINDYFKEGSDWMLTRSPSKIDFSYSHQRFAYALTLISLLPQSCQQWMGNIGGHLLHHCPRKELFDATFIADSILHDKCLKLIQIQRWVV